MSVQYFCHHHHFIPETHNSKTKQDRAGAFLAATVWGGQRGGNICIWGGAGIPDDIMHD